MEDLRGRIADLMPVVRDELAELVALRSVADPRQFPAEECERAARWVLEKFADLGFSDARLEETADGSMAVVKTYCPDELPDFPQTADQFKTANLVNQ